MKQAILIIDFGSQLTKLIARRVREIGVFSLIIPYDRVSARNFNEYEIKGLIFSGGPKSIDNENYPKLPDFIYNKGIPIFGICYGLQLLCKKFGGKLKYSEDREFGKREIEIKKKIPLFNKVYSIGKKYQVWMSHSDSVDVLPSGFEIVASSRNCKSAVIQNIEKQIFGVQFHPEVVHTIGGSLLLENFVIRVCKSEQNWNMRIFKNQMIKNIKDKVGNSEVICGLSGGVDSTVTAVLIHKAIKGKLKCVFVDTGLMRMNEANKIKSLFEKNLKISISIIDASKEFFSKLKGVRDPERKRKIIGKLFVKYFEQYSLNKKNIKFLAQGTLYPDVIESSSKIGDSSVTIKSHHNVGGLPKKMKLKLIEPLRELFKDEVRKLGNELGISNDLTGRHPFPGPGLGIRVLGEVNKNSVEILRKADDIFINLIKKHKLYKKIWQAFCVLLPIKSVGVMGDDRTYERICILRAVTSVDGMTAESFEFKDSFLKLCATEIINNVEGINRVCYDYTSKPPGTIEFE